MPQILTIIEQQNFQIIATRIAEIIMDEIAYQAAITYDAELEALTTFIERADPFNHTQSPCINVAYAATDYTQKHQGSADGNNTFNIDFYGNKKHTEESRGDKSAALLVQKFVGIVRCILENPVYNTLGYEKGFIGGTMVQKIQVAEQDDKDARSNYMSRITFNVRLNETTAYKEPRLIQGYETTVKISDSEQGYKWIGETYGA